jgi:hypothetical protein
MPDVPIQAIFTEVSLISLNEMPETCGESDQDDSRFLARENAPLTELDRQLQC